jgi:hypothetical protein
MASTNRNTKIKLNKDNYLTNSRYLSDAYEENSDETDREADDVTKQPLIPSLQATHGVSKWGGLTSQAKRGVHDHN